VIQLTITRIVLASGPRVGRRVELLARMYAPVQVAAPRRYRLKGFEAANDDSAQLYRPDLVRAQPGCNGENHFAGVPGEP
jgi:hypothetical protein